MAKRTTNEKDPRVTSTGPSENHITNEVDSTQLPLDFAPPDVAIKTVRTGSKIETILRVFLRGISLNRFEAESHHDHCLHSTVSTLQNGFGILISRQSEVVPCLHGSSTVRVNRYWLDTAPDNLAAARALLGMMVAA